MDLGHGAAPPLRLVDRVQVFLVDQDRALARQVALGAHGLAALGLVQTPAHRRGTGGSTRRCAAEPGGSGGSRRAPCGWTVFWPYDHSNNAPCKRRNEGGTGILPVPATGGRACEPFDHSTSLHFLGSRSAAVRGGGALLVAADRGRFDPPFGRERGGRRGFAP